MKSSKLLKIIDPLNNSFIKTSLSFVFSPHGKLYGWPGPHGIPVLTIGFKFGSVIFLASGGLLKKFKRFTETLPLYSESGTVVPVNELFN